MLNKALKKQKIPVEIVFGAENYAEFDIDYNFKINGHRYFLIEFPMQSYPDFCDKIIDSLISKGIIPVISDVETNQGIKEDPSIVSKLISKGCLIQLMASSLFSAHKDFALFLLKNNAYHVFASNAHDAEGYKVFSKGLEILKRYVDDSKIISMTHTIPSKIVNGDKVKVEKIKLGSFDKGFKKFFRNIYS